jgi:NADP-dependent 3-hydroxy acid dehydrogenase YdfG
VTRDARERWAVVTGCHGGIGGAVADKLAVVGLKVVGVDRVAAHRDSLDQAVVADLGDEPSLNWLAGPA